MKTFVHLPLGLMILLFSCTKPDDSQNNNSSKENGLSEMKSGVPTIIISDLYYPPQDDDDNFDMIMGYGLPEIDLKAVILDITGAFLKPVADHPLLWQDPYGPREAGIIPMMQLNYIFNRDVPFAVSPYTLMESPFDKMDDIPGFQQKGVELLLSTLKASQEKVQILSFGSARALAVAYNRDSALIKDKVEMIHLNMGMVYKEGTKLDEIERDLSKSIIAAWNVKLDTHAFVRLLRSDLPIALYPCGSWNGMGKNNTFWELKSLTFIADMDEKLQRYMDYFFRVRKQDNFLQAMDLNALPDTNAIKKYYTKEFYLWTTESWLQAANLVLVGKGDADFTIKKRGDVDFDEKIISGELFPCTFTVSDKGAFVYSKTVEGVPTNFKIYERADPVLNQKAFNKAIPELYKSFDPDN